MSEQSIMHNRSEFQHFQQWWSNSNDDVADSDGEDDNDNNNSNSMKVTPTRLHTKMEIFHFAYLKYWCKFHFYSVKKIFLVAAYISDALLSKS